MPGLLSFPSVAVAVALLALLLLQGAAGDAKTVAVAPQETRPCPKSSYLTVAGHIYWLMIPGGRALVPLRLVERGVVVFSDLQGDFYIRDACKGEELTVESDLGNAAAPLRSITWLVQESVLVPKQGIILQSIPLPLWGVVTISSTVAAKAPWDRLHSCYFLVTVTLKGKYYCDPLPQGPAGAVLQLTDSTGKAFPGKMFYAGTWLGNLTTTTTFTTQTSTSIDGGVFIPNVPVSSKAYTVTATLNGCKFTSPLMKCDSPGLLVNAGPHNGPTIRE